MNNSLLAVYITVFDPRRGKRRCFISFMVYALVYPSIASDLLNWATLSPKSYYVYTHTCSPLSRKPLLRRPRMAETANNMVASVKYIWVIATPLSVD